MQPQAVLCRRIYPTTSSDVAADEISNSPSRPASLTIFFIMYSAIGLLHMFPRHTKSIFCMLLIVSTGVSAPRLLRGHCHIAKIINALQINPLDIDASGYIIDTLRVMALCSCQEVPLKRGLDSIHFSENSRKSLSLSELQPSFINAGLPRGSGFCRQMPPESQKLTAILS